MVSYDVKFYWLGGKNPRNFFHVGNIAKITETRLMAPRVEVIIKNDVFFSISDKI